MRINSLFFLLFACNILHAQSTIGLVQYDKDNTDGYILFSGISSKKTYLIDKCGEKIKEWNSNFKPGLSFELLPNGDLFRTGLSTSNYFGTGGGKGGILEKYDWNGNLIWSYQVSDSNQCQHHDALVLPNGNILAIVWDRKTLSQATQAGKNPAITAALTNQEVWSEKLVEIQPTDTNTATIVWEWKAWDHLVQDFDVSKSNYSIVQQHPELINVNYVSQGPPGNPDWLHINSVDYNPVTDEIILSNHNFSEIWIIDHSTTTTQAASHMGGVSGKGGDLLYRWGNPMTYDRGTVSDQKLFKQHHATFIKSAYPNAGKILVFNNGVNRPVGNYSSVDIIDIAQAGYPYSIGSTSAYLPSTTFWNYTASTPSSFYAPNISGVYPLINGSFFITDGPKGEFIEIDSSSSVKWRYINPVNSTGPMTQGTIPSLNTVFRANFYSPSFSAFSGKTLTPNGEIELNPTSPSLCAWPNTVSEINKNSFGLYPNPVEGAGELKINHYPYVQVKIALYDACGRLILKQEKRSGENTSIMKLPNLQKGIYFLNISMDNMNHAEKVIIN